MASWYTCWIHHLLVLVFRSLCGYTMYITLGLIGLRLYKHPPQHELHVAYTCTVYTSQPHDLCVN